MSGRRWVASYRALVMVILLMTATGVTLLHWHKEWSGQGCELCHVRQLPILTAPAAEGPAAPTTTERQWQIDSCVREIEVCSLTEASRAPPQAV